MEQIKEYIPKACPHGDSMILDSEVSELGTLMTFHGRTCSNHTFHYLQQVLLVDNKTGDPLPFGTLGIHKVLYSLIMGLRMMNNILRE